MGSVADGIDALEEIASDHPAVEALIRHTIATHLLPAMRVAMDLRDAAAKVETDGTPSQVGPSADELRSLADVLQPTT